MKDFLVAVFLMLAEVVLFFILFPVELCKELQWRMAK
jgi:hypothetical protein